MNDARIPATDKLYAAGASCSFVHLVGPCSLLDKEISHISLTQSNHRYRILPE
jgi:hypothetical protein